MLNPFRPLAALTLLGALAGCVGVAPPVVVQPAPYAVAPAPIMESLTPPNVPLVAYGSACYAGAYQCQLRASLPIGSECACPGLGAPSYGVVR